VRRRGIENEKFKMENYEASGMDLEVVDSYFLSEIVKGASALFFVTINSTS
jgi:hypothetical protein